MRKFFVSLTAMAVTAAASIGLVAALAGPAAASTSPPWEPDANAVGGLVFYNSAGQQITGGNLTDQPLAAYVQGTSAIRAGDTKATLFGYLPVDGEAPGQWSGEAVSGSTTYPNASAPAALAGSALPLVTGAAGDESVATLASDFPNTDTSGDGYAGLYVLRLKTSASGKSTTSQYDAADISVSGDTWSVVYPAPELTATGVSVAASPASPQVAGTSVTLDATVSPSAPGTVQFEVGSTALGSPVPVDDGAASLATTSLPVGDDTVNAVFTPAQFSAYSGSTGSTSFTVTPAPAASTLTALSVDPSTAAADTSVEITAAVSASASGDPLASGSGQVQFYDDGTDASGDITSNSILLGSVDVGSGGIASLPFSSFATGTHNLVAEFVPGDPSTYNSSTSLAVLFTASAPAIAPASQTVDVDIPAGAITITTPYSSVNPFQLGTAVLDPTDSQYRASADFGDSTNPGNGVTITDTRAGDLPWTASATVTDFQDGSGDLVNGQNLTFTDVTPSYVAGNALQSGDVTTTDVDNAAVYAAGAPGSDGLKGGPHQFAAAAAGEGSVDIDGVLTLVAPTSTPAGEYTATLTFTVV